MMPGMHRVRPCLLALEDRLLPSGIFTVTNTDDLGAELPRHCFVFRKGPEHQSQLDPLHFLVQLNQFDVDPGEFGS